MLDTKQNVADLVLEHSECAEVFHRHRIDFCCGGQMSVEAAAAKKRVDLETLVDELSQAISTREREDSVDVRTLSTPQLIDYIVSTHHAYLRSVLPFVRKLSAKVARVHGERNPRLHELDGLLWTLDETLILHLDEEETSTFPTLLEASDPATSTPLIEAMVDDHRAVGALLAKLRNLSNDFTPPDWACGSYRTLFAELKELQRDVHIHVHIENNVLAPRIAGIAAGAPPS